ncbi:MAG: hypothetical protein K2N88_08420 [Muribaculaceae bacterium]|nr:hypothetical protein [Muribaculaceae bacterium]
MKRTQILSVVITSLAITVGFSTSCTNERSTRNENAVLTDSIAETTRFEPLETSDGWNLVANGAFAENVDVNSVHNAMSKLIDYPSYRISVLCSKGGLAGSPAMTVWIFKKENEKIQYLKGEHELIFGDLPSIKGVPAEGFSIPEESIEEAVRIMDQGSFKVLLKNPSEHTTYELKVNNQTKGALEAWGKLNND